MDPYHLTCTYRMLLRTFAAEQRIQLPYTPEHALVLVTLSGSRKLRELHDEIWRRQQDGSPRSRKQAPKGRRGRLVLRGSERAGYMSYETEPTGGPD
jgi:hypothetical protein